MILFIAVITVAVAVGIWKTLWLIFHDEYDTKATWKWWN